MTMVRNVLIFSAALAVAMAPTVATAQPRTPEPTVSRLVSGLQGTSGSTVGPDGALYVTEATAGRVTRIDPRTGATRTVASGLPTPVIGIGGAIDVAFLGRTAYVLVTLVDASLGGRSIDGIYRVDGPNTFTVVADIGQFASDNPPDTEFFVETGLQYAMEPYRGGFLVTDGHHNRVYRVTLDGRVRELIAFDNTVPTGLAVRGRTIYMAEAGPVPHLPETGRIVKFGPRAETATEVAVGARLLVDVEFGRGNRLYALSQGVFGGGDPGAPAAPNTGSLVIASRGGFRTVVDGLDRPSSFEIIKNTAYVVTLAGEVLKISNLYGPHRHGRR
jgi:hypothetical protein